MDSDISVLSGPFMASIVIFAVSAYMGWRNLLRAHRRGARIAGVVTLGLSLLMGLYVCTRTVLPDRAVAEADFTHTGDLLLVPAVDEPVSLFVSGHLPSVAQNQSSAVKYKLVLLEGDDVVDHFTGTVEEHWERQRVGRGVRLPTLVAHEEGRFDLPPQTEGQELRVRLDFLDGTLVGPLHASAVEAPPSMAAVATIGLATMLLGAVVDASESRRTGMALYAGFYAVFSGALLRGILPHSPALAVVGPLLMGVFAGVGAGWALRDLVHTLWRLATRPMATAT